MNRSMSLGSVFMTLAAMGGIAMAQDPAPTDPAAPAAPATDPAATDPVATEPAATDTAAAAYSASNWPNQLVNRPLTFGKGMIAILGNVNVNLSEELVGKPISLAPDIYYGVSDVLSVGLTHNTGLCLTGTDGGCAKVYNDLGIDALYRLSRNDKMELAAHGGIDVAVLDPFVSNLRLGVQLRYTMDKIGVFADPSISIGLTKREGRGDGLSIPLRLAYQASDKLAAYIDTGINEPSISDFGDALGVPLGVGALFAASSTLDFGGRFYFDKIAGEGGNTDSRSLLLQVNYRM